MTSGDIALRQAARQMADRLQVFQGLASRAQQRRDRINLAPCEMWEPEDQAALDAYQDALNQINGAQPLPMEIPA